MTAWFCVCITKFPLETEDNGSKDVSLMILKKDRDRDEM